MNSFQTIVHPTDFSEASVEAFVHALRIALTMKSTLYILHVGEPRGDVDWTAFPHVRQTLARWGLMDESEPPAAIATLGVNVVKAELALPSTINAILHFLDAHSADLLVLATEGRQGVARWLHGSVAESLARHAKVPTLFVPARAPGFVNPARGELHLRHVLIPIDHHPKPASALTRIMLFTNELAGTNVEERLLHVGKHAPQVQRRVEPHRPLPVALRQGNAVEVIIDVANDWPADLIGMPTAGRNGFIDAIRGSTTERVLRQAPCPVLAVPAQA